LALASTDDRKIITSARTWERGLDPEAKNFDTEKQTFSRETFADDQPPLCD